MNYTELIESLRQEENSSGLNYLWHLHYDSLVYFASQIIRNNISAEDIVTDTFLKFWERRGNFDHPAAIASFLYTTVRNAAYDILRAQEIHARIHDEILHATDSRICIIAEDDDYNSKYEQYIHYLLKEIKALPERCGEILELLIVESMPVSKIASNFKISKQTVRNQKTKGISRLRERLSKIYP